LFVRWGFVVVVVFVVVTVKNREGVSGGVSDIMSLAGGGSSSARGLGVVSDKPQPSRQAGGAGDAAAGRERKPQRLKREDHGRVKHDDCFSEWKV